VAGETSTVGTGTGLEDRRDGLGRAAALSIPVDDAGICAATVAAGLRSDGVALFALGGCPVRVRPPLLLEGRPVPLPPPLPRVVGSPPDLQLSLVDIGVADRGLQARVVEAALAFSYACQSFRTIISIRTQTVASESQPVGDGKTWPIWMEVQSRKGP